MADSKPPEISLDEQPILAALLKVDVSPELA